MTYTEQDIDRIIEMAWEDRTPFEAITFQFQLKEQEKHILHIQTQYLQQLQICR